MSQAVAVIRQDVKHAASTVHRRWIDIGPKEDLEQDLWCEILDKDNSALPEKLAALEPGDRKAVLINLAHRCASRERDSYLLWSGKYIYGTEEVKAALKEGVDTDELCSLETLSFRLDMQDAMKCIAKTNPSYVQAIEDYYLHEIKPDDAGRMRLTRARDRLTLEMNRVNTRRHFDYSQSVTGRAAVSNSTGQHYVKDDNDDCDYFDS